METNLLKIINHYGLSNQLKYIHSEYFELDEAIIRCEHYPGGVCQALKELYTSHIVEEIADVMVMLKQFQYYYDIEDSEIEKIMEEKINRQLERIKKEEYDKNR